ncbi:hypothetical protein [Streptomyces sp. NPDC001546]|uniref:hypothetical protein n=1 Tax=Streptomyces sp. NPDC001546 TaxID=3364585 RepID=UPI0036AF6AF0
MRPPAVARRLADQAERRTRACAAAVIATNEGCVVTCPQGSGAGMSWYAERTSAAGSG